MSQSKAKKKRMHIKRTVGKDVEKIDNLSLLVHMNV